jgi:hypothetical protein
MKIIVNTVQVARVLEPPLWGWFLGLSNINI